jgi:predicted MFS family arabinose efflux permease
VVPALHASGSAPRIGRRPTTLIVAVAFAVAMLGATLPTPLYGLYRQEIGFSEFMVTVVFAAYAVGVIAALLLLGRWSDQIGRKPILLAGLVASAVSAAVFIVADDLTLLFVGRVVSGLSAGMFTGAATATIIELAAPGRRGRATLLATAVNAGGLGLGPLVAGLISEAFGDPLRVVFVVDLVVVAVLILLVAVIPEPGRRVEHPQLAPQRLSVPAAVRPVFLPAALSAFAGFAVLGLYTAVVPALLTHDLGVTDRAIVGLVVFLVFGSSAVGQATLELVPAAHAQTIGVATLGGGALVMGLGVVIGSLALLIAGGITAAIGQGLSFRAGMAAITGASPPAQRGEVASAYFVVAYVAISVPVVGVGVLGVLVGREGASEIFSLVVAAIAATSMVLLRRTATAGSVPAVASDSAR